MCEWRLQCPLLHHKVIPITWSIRLLGRICSGTSDPTYGNDSLYPDLHVLCSNRGNGFFLVIQGSGSDCNTNNVLSGNGLWLAYNQSRVLNNKFLLVVYLCNTNIVLSGGGRWSTKSIFWSFTIIWRQYCTVHLVFWCSNQQPDSKIIPGYQSK